MSAFDEVVGRGQAYRDGRADAIHQQALRARRPIGWRARIRILFTGRVVTKTGELIDYPPDPAP